jgi:hypothetical protein
MIKSALCVFVMCVSMLVLSAPAANAQQTEPAKQPVVYTYVSLFGVPRAQWPAYEKGMTAERKIFDGLMADGTLVGYGAAAVEVHEGANAPTHIDWFSSTSLAGLTKALAAIRSGAPPAADIAYTMHADAISSSTMYGGKAGSIEGGYMLVQNWTPKPGQSRELIDLFAKYRKPSLDAAVADGSLTGYSLDEDLIHTSTPGEVELVATFPNAAALDKFYKEIESLHTTQPLFGDVYGAATDPSMHRDHLLRVLFSVSK